MLRYTNERFLPGNQIRHRIIFTVFRYDSIRIGDPWITDIVTNITSHYKKVYFWSDQYAMVYFESDASVNKRGFQIEYYKSGNEQNTSI